MRAVVARKSSMSLVSPRRKGKEWMKKGQKRLGVKGNEEFPERLSEFLTWTDFARTMRPSLTPTNMIIVHCMKT